MMKKRNNRISIKKSATIENLYDLALEQKTTQIKADRDKK